jgi:5-methylcytosine-specific restriction endonuclease McrA
MRVRVFAEQYGICAAPDCRELCTELDHVLNVKRGGSDARENLQGLCAAHHREKTQLESRGGRV